MGALGYVRPKNDVFGPLAGHPGSLPPWMTPEVTGKIQACRSTMTRQTAVMDLLAFTSQCQERYGNMRPWPERPWGSGRSAAKDAMFSLLTWFSGGDVASFLRDALSVDDMLLVASEAYGALRLLGTVCSDTAPKERYKLVKVCKQSAGTFLTRPILVELGWNCSHNLWLSCDSPESRDMGGRPAIKPSMAAAVAAHCEDVSQPVNRRTIKKRKGDDSGDYTDCVVRRMDCSFLGAWHRFQYRGAISYTAFYNLIPAECKLIARPSDMCDYCEAGKRAEHSVTQLRQVHKAPDDATLLQLFTLYKAPATRALSVAAHRVILYYTHQREYRVIRQDYNVCIKTPEPDCLTIDYDWEAMLTLPLGPVGTNLAQYHKKSVALLGIGFYWLVGGVHKQAHVDIVSDKITEDAHCSIIAIEKALQMAADHHWFDIRQFKKVVMWSDCGQHFRCGEFLQYALDVMQTKYGILEAICNFLAEKHGRNRRDGHFSVIQRYIHAYCESHTMWRSTDVVAAIRHGHAAVADENCSKQSPTIPLLADHMSLPASIKYDMNTRDFDHVRTYLCFKRLGAQYFVARHYSAGTCVEVHPGAECYEVTYQPRESCPKPYPTDDELYDTLHKKLETRENVFGDLV